MKSTIFYFIALIFAMLPVLTSAAAYLVCLAACASVCPPYVPGCLAACAATGFAPTHMTCGL